MMLEVFTHLFITGVFRPQLQSLRAFFMPFYLGLGIGFHADFCRCTTHRPSVAGA